MPFQPEDRSPDGESYGDGSQTRSFCYVDDMVEGFLALMASERFEGPVNLGRPQEVTIADLAERVVALTGSRSEIRSIPRKEWTGSAFLADPWELSDAAARKLLGYRPMESAEAKASLKKAIGNCWEAMTRKA